MKKISKTLFLIAVLGIPVFAQAEPYSYEAFINELSLTNTFTGVENIVDKAEDVFAGKKKQIGRNKEELAKEILGFALFRKAVLLKLNEGNASQAFKSGLGIQLLDFYKKNAGKLDQLFEDTIEIYEKDLRIRTIELATAKFEFARTNEQKTVTMDMNDTWKMRLARHSKNQELFLDAFDIRSGLLGERDDMVLVTALYLANSFMLSSDFEKALPYYEKYIAGFREKYGDKSEYLLSSLLMTGSIWNLVGNQDSVKMISNEISQITGEQADFGEVPLNLAPRAAKFKYKGINPIRAGKIYDGITVPPDGIVVPADTVAVNNRLPSGNSSTMVKIKPGVFNLKFVDAVRVLINVDTKGNVVQVMAETSDSDLKVKVEKNVRKWKFQPFVYKDKAMTMDGYVYYYDLEK